MIRQHVYKDKSLCSMNYDVYKVVLPCMVIIPQPQKYSLCVVLAIKVKTYIKREMTHSRAEKHH